MEIFLPYERFVNLELPISYVEANGNYYLFATDEDVKYNCVVWDLSDQADFEETLKESSTSLA